MALCEMKFRGGHTAKSIEQAREAMGIDWMIWGELVEAIPPNYTKYIGDQIYKELN
jgi:DNA (cytosine-5)-methyltransferase 1